MLKEERLNRIKALWAYRSSERVRKLIRFYLNETGEYTIDNIPSIVSSYWSIRDDYVSNGTLKFLLWALQVEVYLANEDDIKHLL